ncbi:hypothetical protein ACOSP7_013812 [Xanthoceras sorbifolium]
MGFTGPSFTWCNGRSDNHFVQERLDCGVCNIEWSDLFPSSFVQHLDFWQSDHRPLLIHILHHSSDVSSSKRGSKRFLFEECWAADEGCDNIIKSTWNQNCNNNISESVLSNLSACSKKLQLWNKSNRVQLRQGILAKRRELLDLNLIHNPADWKKMKDIETELNKLLEVKEVYWKQRSRVHWLKSSDRNTRFFHAKAKARKIKNTLMGLFDVHGAWHEKGI